MLERKGRHFLLFLSPALLHIFYPACVHGRDSLVIVYLKGRNPRIVSSFLRVFPPFLYSVTVRIMVICVTQFIFEAIFERRKNLGTR